jgi:hypothetical protein
MMNDSDRRRQPPEPGLCARCRHARVVTSVRGSRFVACDRSRTDPAYARYPRLPVLTCAGVDALPEPPENGEPEVG